MIFPHGSQNDKQKIKNLLRKKENYYWKYGVHLREIAIHLTYFYALS